MTKLCVAGNHEVEVSEFWSRLGKLQPNCKVCQSTINKQRYQVHKTAHIKSVTRSRKERADRFKQWKSKLRCSLCPEAFGGCLDFHHLGVHKKEDGIAQLVSTVGIEKLADELRKCAVVCRNCHTKIHCGVIDATGLMPISEEAIDELVRTWAANSAVE